MDPYERAARVYCDRLGLDPDETIAASARQGVSAARDGEPDGPRWTFVVRSVKEAEAMQSALLALEERIT